MPKTYPIIWKNKVIQMALPIFIVSFIPFPSAGTKQQERKLPNNFPQSHNSLPMVTENCGTLVLNSGDCFH